MAEAFECDRCGAFESGEPEKEVPVEVKVKNQRFKRTPTQIEEATVDVHRLNADLCSGCAERLANFMEGKLGFRDP